MHSLATSQSLGETPNNKHSLWLPHGQNFKKTIRYLNKIILEYFQQVT